MAITLEFNGDIARVVLSGGIDYSKQEEFKNANIRALSAGGITTIHVDFAAVNFLDSSAIRALLILKKQAEASGKSVVLLNCSDTLCSIFEIGGFDRVFTFR